MPEDSEKARFWADFLVEHADCPEALILRQHLDGATFHTFCPCGCCSFQIAVADRNTLPPLILPNPTLREGHCAFFTVERTLSDGRNLGLDAFCDAEGILWGIDVDINANTEPVPDPVEATNLLGLK